MQAFLRHTGRPTSNLIPTVWMRTRVVGFIAKCLDAMILQRPSDHQRRGSGTIFMDKSDNDLYLIRGSGTNFREEVKSGDTLFLPRFNGSTASATVERVISSDVLVLKRPFHPLDTALQQLHPDHGSSYSIAPKLNRTELYTNIATHLAKQGSIMIFPEGASHDTPGFIPFHSGVAIMALEEKLQYPHSGTVILPCGIRYSAPHVWRSTVDVEFGEPIRVSNAMLEQYQSDGREDAVASLMNSIQEGLNHTVLKPQDSNQTPQLAVKRPRKLRRRSRNRNRNRNRQYAALQSTPYSSLHHLVQSARSTSSNFLQRTTRISLLCILTILALPALIIFLPLFLPIEIYVRRRARLATTFSPWRKYGLDTFATNRGVAWVSTLPVLITIYTGLATLSGIRMEVALLGTLGMLSCAAWWAILIMDKIQNIRQL